MMTDAERMEFLTTYEELGPGGLTKGEQIELHDLRLKLAVQKKSSEPEYYYCALKISNVKFNAGTMVWTTNYRYRTSVNYLAADFPIQMIGNF